MILAALPVFFTLLVILAGSIWLSLSIRFRSISLLPENHSLLALPLIILGLATLGSWLTVGFWGHISILGTLVLGLSLFLLKPEWTRPKYDLWPVAGFSAFGLFLAALRFYILWQPGQNQFLCTHHDDYSYIQQINLLALTGKESHFAELTRLAFGMEYRFSLYHLIEFYLVLLFKGLAPSATYSWFHFFLKPIFSAWAAFSLYVYARSVSAKAINSLALGGLVVLVFSSLRFNLLDEYVQHIGSAAYWKSVFFQNYYFAAPLSYHVSYKISIALIFLLPLAVGLFELSFAQLIVFLLAATAASVGLLPMAMALIAGKAAIHWVGLQVYIRLIGVGLMALFLLMPLAPGADHSGYLKGLYASGFYLFNLVFENHYWLLFWGFLGLIAAGRGLSLRVKLGFILLFPLVYFSPGFLFKLFAFGSLGLTGYSLFRNKAWQKSSVFLVFIPALAALGMLMPWVSFLPNVQQIFTNLIFTALALLVLEVFGWKAVSLDWRHSWWIFPVFFGIQIPALLYDNRTPLHEENIPEEVFRQPCFEKKMVRVLSISAYAKFPAIDEYMLGHGLLNRKSNVVISLAGPEQFDSAQIAVFKQSPLWKPISRIPYFDAYFQNGDDLKSFIKKHEVDFLLVEDSPAFDQTRAICDSLAKAKWKEPARNYWIFAMKP